MSSMGLEGWVTEQAEDTYDDRGRRVSGSLSGYGLGPAGMKLESAILRRVEQMIAKSQQPVQTPAIEQEKTVTFDAASFRDANGRVMVSVVRQSNGRYRVIGGPDDSESREAGLSTAQLVELGIFFGNIGQDLDRQRKVHVEVVPDEEVSEQTPTRKRTAARKSTSSGKKMSAETKAKISAARKKQEAAKRKPVAKKPVAKKKR